MDLGERCIMSLSELYPHMGGQLFSVATTVRLGRENVEDGEESAEKQERDSQAGQYT